MGPTGQKTGYGTVADEMSKALEELGHVRDEKGVKIYHGIPYPSIGGAKYVYTMFEMMPALKEWGPVLNHAKTIFTGSTYSAACLRPVTKRPVVPIAHGVRQDLYVDRLPSDVFKFGCFAEHVPRKFLRETITAFTEEFGPDEKVKLYVKTWSANKNVADLFVGKKNVVMVTGNVADMKNLYAAMDGYVLPSVEGWGLTQMEAIASGLKPIVLDFGGVKDFCNKDNSVLVAPGPEERCPIDPRFEFMKPYMKWRRPDKGALMAAMRRVVKNGGEWLDEKQAKDFASSWTWRRCVEEMLKHVDVQEL
jgi:glycosyltransferase involved in cell wall biosynthesis